MIAKPRFDGEWVGFQDAFEEVSRGVRKIKQKDYLASGFYPIVDQSQSAVAGYSNEQNGLYVDVPAIVFGDHTRCVKYVETPFFIGADGVKILKPKLSDDVRYWWHALRATPIENLGYSRHYKLLKEKLFRSFDLDMQVSIRRKLDRVLLEIDCAEQVLSKLDVLVKSRFVEMFGSCTRCVSLADVCCFRSGKTLPKSNEMPSGDYLYAKVGDLNLPGNERVIKSSRSYVNADVAKNLIPKGAVVFPKRGGAISTNKKRVTARDCCLDLNLMAVIPGEQICTEYLLAWFDQMDLAEIANGSAVPQINNKDLEPLIIPLPQMEAQQEFASFVAQVDKSRFVVQRQIGKLRTLYDSRAQIVQQPIAQMLWTQRAVVQP